MAGRCVAAGPHGRDAGMSDRGWGVPTDWDGESWSCIALQWPDSEQFRALLIGLLYTLTRGRSYDRDRGTIKTGQVYGWEIFNRNYPLNSCDGEELTFEEASPCSGGLIVLQEDDMGQVVTNVYVDTATGELVVEFGPCCVFRYPIAAGQVEPGEYEWEPETPGIPPDIETPADPMVYTKCGKASIYVERIEAVARAAWDNRLTPYQMADAIKQANPGYSVAMEDVTNLWIAAIELSAIELLADSDIFNVDFLEDLKCYIYARTADNEAKGLSKTEWNIMLTGWLTAYPFVSEQPDLDVVADLIVANWWYVVMAFVLGYERSMQIMGESIGQTGDCTRCEEGPAIDPDLPTESLPSGYYLGHNLAAEVTRFDDGAVAHNYHRLIVPADCYGVYIQVSPYTPNTTKRTDWKPAVAGVDVDHSMWTDTSDHLETEGFELGYPMVYFGDAGIAAELAALLGYSGPLVTKTGSLLWPLPEADKGVLLGTWLQNNDETVVLNITQWRYILKAEG